MKVGSKRILYMASTRGSCGVVKCEYRKKRKHRNKDHRIRKALQSRLRHRMDALMGLDCIPLPLPQPSSFEGFKEGEFVILTSKIKYAKKQKYIKNEKEQREENNNE